VAARLRNTRAVCRKSYIHPFVFEAYRHGVTIAAKRAGPVKPYFSHQEAATLALLKSRARQHAKAA
jgi:DNA topoisomerase IB